MFLQCHLAYQKWYFLYTTILVLSTLHIVIILDDCWLRFEVLFKKNLAVASAKGFV